MIKDTRALYILCAEILSLGSRQYGCASQVLLVIRGTSSLPEALTDLAGSIVDFPLGGSTHHGIHQCAQWLLAHETEPLAGLLAERPGYRLKLVGHSLGAGAAALLGMLIHDDEKVRGPCYS